jgi:ATP adenylyltransferase
MDRLWSPWRYRYVSKASPNDACIFCEAAARNEDSETFIVHRASRNFAILNLYPYTTGHLMIAPYEHVPTLELAHKDTLTEMIQLASIAEKHLRTVYRPQGFNIGMNIGECAGAGVAGHIHLHVLPRWMADANFATTVGETRIMPEDLRTTYEKLVGAWHQAE